MPRKKTYHTKQQNKILEAFTAHPEQCYTARQLAALLSGDRIGEATIYRALQKLTADGLIKKFAPAPGTGDADSRLNPACYQYIGREDDCREHFHLKCLRCGSVIHMDCGFMGEINRHLAEEHHFTVDNSQTTLYGLCGACAGPRKRKEDGNDGPDHR